MFIKKNYLNFKLKGLRNDNITFFNNNNLNEPLLNNKGFNNKLRKV
jgi:hypothetical protein